jgi:hypothetical protein
MATNQYILYQILTLMTYFSDIFSFGSTIFYNLKKMVSILKDKNNKSKYFIDENYSKEETSEEVTMLH